MTTDSLEILGYIAGVLTTSSLLPQFFKSWKSKSTKDLSYGMILILFFGVLLWAIYGISIHSLPVIIFNTLTVIFSFSLLLLKLKYK
jgi:MtN3 and saliva related transmembrane protein